jgi:glutathione synthase/RimK-type ligase-like ATP-grasp enzyme
MTVCIISNINDEHAIYVELALIKKGEDVINWHWADFPSISRCSVEFSSSGEMKLPFLNQASENISLWIHRGVSPVVPANAHPADVDFIKIESHEMLRGILNEIASKSFCVNPIDSVQKLRSKINQLSLAVKCGLSIPPSLFSNDPKEIRRFFNDYDGEIIAKHSAQMFWESSETNSIHMIYTNKINSNHLSNEMRISMCPSIYQKEVTKSFELRIVFFGKNIFTIKIDSQAAKESIDWRKDYQECPPCTIFELPVCELRKIKLFISESKLLYGSIDCIVDKKGDYIFLEVNETGQFLWIEHLLPDLPLLDCFADFLINRSADFEYKPGNNIVKISEFNNHLSHEAINSRMIGHIEREHPGKIIES